MWAIRSRMGIVFQNPDNQFVGSTVQDDVAFALENNGVPFEDMVNRVHEALAQVKMSDFLDHEPHHLIWRTEATRGDCRRTCLAATITYFR